MWRSLCDINRDINSDPLGDTLLLSADDQPVAVADSQELLAFESAYEDTESGHLNCLLFTSAAARRNAVYELHLATAARDLAERDLGGPCSPAYSPT